MYDMYFEETVAIKKQRITDDFKMIWLIRYSLIPPLKKLSENPYHLSFLLSLIT